MPRTLGIWPSIFCEKDENEWWGGFGVLPRHSTGRIESMQQLVAENEVKRFALTGRLEVRPNIIRLSTLLWMLYFSKQQLSAG